MIVLIRLQHPDGRVEIKAVDVDTRDELRALLAGTTTLTREGPPPTLH